MRYVDNLTGPWSAYSISHDNFHELMPELTLEAPLEHVARTRTVTE